jgi:hypothetical protein
MYMTLVPTRTLRHKTRDAVKRMHVVPDGATVHKDRRTETERLMGFHIQQDKFLRNNPRLPVCFVSFALAFWL